MTEQLNFTKSNVRKDKSIRLKYVGDFPKQFELHSPSGKSCLMILDADATKEYWMQNEGWDGEYYAALYFGEIEGKSIRAELGHTPYD